DCRVGIDDGGVRRNGGDAYDVASAPAGGMVERHAYSALRRGAVETAFPLSVPVSRAFSETLPDFQADDSDGEAVGIEVQHHEVRLERVDGGLGGVNGIGPERYKDDVFDFPAFFGAGVEQVLELRRPCQRGLRELDACAVAVAKDEYPHGASPDDRPRGGLGPILSGAWHT